jgi:hypothetical protein
VTFAVCQRDLFRLCHSLCQQKNGCQTRKSNTQSFKERN